MKPTLRRTRLAAAMTLSLCLASSHASSRHNPGLLTRDGYTGGAEESVELVISLQTDKRVYEQGETLELDIVVKNIGQTTVYLYATLGWGPLSSFDLHFSDESGKQTHPSFFPDSQSPPPYQPDEFAPLSPRHFLGKHLSLSLEELNLTEPGKYTIVAEYHSPVWQEFAPKLDVWTREKGSIYSEPVHIEITSSQGP